MKNFETSTPLGTEGINISYSSEESSAKDLLKVLPKGWKVHFDWAQILFTDVQYQIDFPKRIVYVVYNQNLHIWWKELVAEVRRKVETKKATSPEVA